MRQVSYYNPDDVKPRRTNPAKTPKPTKLRSNITPGTVLIVLAGRFKGRRVVFLKQLPSGLLLVTGPYKLNGVPLRRLNQAYVIGTSTKVNLDGVNMDKVDEAYFAKNKQKREQTEGGLFFERKNELTEADQQNLKKKRDFQVNFDKALLANIKKVNLLGKYLSNRFSLRKGMRVHEMSF